MLKFPQHAIQTCTYLLLNRYTKCSSVQPSELEVRTCSVLTYMYSVAYKSPPSSSQVCLIISTNTGKVYRPKDSERLILYLKDVNLPKPDKWGTSQLIAFLQQVNTNCLYILVCILHVVLKMIPKQFLYYSQSNTLYDVYVRVRC